MKPSTSATAGLGAPSGRGGGGTTVPGGSAAPAGTVPSSRDARQSWQKITPLTSRLQLSHSAFPQVRQYADAGIFGWTAQFMQASQGYKWRIHHSSLAIHLLYFLWFGQIYFEGKSPGTKTI